MKLNSFGPYLVIVGLCSLLGGYLQYKHKTDIEQIREAYIQQKTQETELVAQKIENSFNAFYQGLRTMSLLPGVQNIDRYGKNFQEDSKKAVQQIYNNTYLNVTLSEVYLLPQSLNPDKIDPNTQKPEEPIITFDEFIVGAKKSEEGSEASEHHEESEELEELEIEEYRLMKTQLEYFSSSFPTNKSFNGLEVPAISGSPVITCDNSEFSRDDFNAKNDKPRQGIVYTVPFYGTNGEYKGAVSGVVRLNVLERLIPKSTHAVVNLSNKYEGSTNPSKELIAAKEFLSTGTYDPNLIFSINKKLKVNDTTSWNLWVALPNSEFYALTSVQQAKTIFYSGLAVVILLGIGLSVAVRASQKYAGSLEQKVAEKTSQLSSRNESMKLILDNAEEGFLTCQLDGTVDTEYSKIVATWFGTPTSETKIWNLFFKDNLKKTNYFKMGWDQLIEDFMPFELSAGQLSTYFERNEKTFMPHFQAIHNAEGKLEKIMVVVKDVSDKVAADKRDQEQKELLSVFHALSNDRSGFLEFFADVENMVKQLSNTKMSKDEQFRIVHTIKGNCGQYGLVTMSEISHSIENQLQDGEDSLSEYQINLLMEVWKDTSNRLISMIGNRESTKIELDEQEYLSILKKIKSGVSHESIAQDIEKWKLLPIQTRLDRMADMSRAVSTKLGVQNLKIATQGNNIRIHPELYKDVWANLIHIIRNAVDHGLRGVTDRSPEISLQAALEGSFLTISIKDNGKGISWDKIKEKAKAMSLPHATHLDLENALFADGVSTAESVSQISGRGVGMAAVKDTVVKNGGQIQISSRQGQGTEFKIFLPFETKGAKQQAA